MHSQKIEALREESERSRLELSQTVDALRSQVAATSEHLKARISPERLKRQGLNKLRQSAIDNPVAAVAVGAAVAYPLLGILRSVPLPIFLIGTGFWLSQRKSAPSWSMSETGGNVERSAPAPVKAHVQSAAETISETTADVRAKAGDIAANVTAKAGDLAANVATKANDLTRQSRNALAELADSNPLMLAGLGLIAGAVVASLFPRTRIEDTVLGGANDTIRQQARDAGSRVVRDAAEGAASTTRKVIETAEREIGTVLDETTGKVQSVIDAGVEAALKTDRGPSNRADQ